MMYSVPILGGTARQANSLKLAGQIRFQLFQLTLIVRLPRTLVMSWPE